MCNYNEPYYDETPFELVKELIGKYGMIPSLRVSWEFSVVHYEVLVDIKSGELYNVPTKGVSIHNNRSRREAFDKMALLAKKEDRLMLGVQGRLHKRESEYILKSLLEGRTIVSKRWQARAPSHFEDVRTSLAYMIL